MTEIQNPKRYDLEERTLEFARKISRYCEKLPRNLNNLEFTKQLIRSAGSVGANYIEANESLGKKDFAMRIRICRKEAKESRYWLSLAEPNKEEVCQKEKLISESTELMKIFGSILEKIK